MRTPACRRMWEAEQAKCIGQIRSCRAGCDRLTGADGGYSNFFANLTASVMARTCYSGCKCGSGFAALLGRAGVALVDSPSSTSGQSRNEERVTGKGREREQASEKTYQCKVFCKDQNGPITYKSVKAATRKQAAEMVGDSANEICANDGLSHASSLRLKESQCVEK